MVVHKVWMWLSLGTLGFGCIKKAKLGPTSSSVKAAVSPGTPLVLFQNSEPLEFELKAPLITIHHDIRKKTSATTTEPGFKGHPSTLVLRGTSGSREIPVLVRARGKTSRGECALPKMTIHFPKESRELMVGTELEGAKNLKLGVHCSLPLGFTPDLFIPFFTFGRLKDDRGPWREELYYRIYSHFSDDHVKSRTASITYTNTDRVNPPEFDDGIALEERLKSFDIKEPRKAFLFETSGTIVDRLGGDENWTELENEQPAPENLTYDLSNAEKMAAFQLIMGNGDWSVGHGNIPMDRNGNALWNILSFFNKVATSVPNAKLFPIDFDLGMFVTERDDGQWEKTRRIAESFMGDVPANPRLFAFDYYANAHSSTVLKDISKRAQTFKELVGKVDSILTEVDKSRVDELTKLRIKKRFESFREAVQQNLLDFAVIDRGATLKNEHGECELFNRSGFTLISETTSELKVALPDWVVIGACNPNFNHFKFSEVIGTIPKSKILGEKFLKLVPPDKRLPENKAIVKAPEMISFVGFNSSSKPSPIKELATGTVCNLPPGDVIVIAIDELAFEKNDGSQALLKEAIPGCPIKVDSAISLDIRNDIQPTG